MSIGKALDMIYDTFDGPSDANDYHARCGTETLGVITVTTPEQAHEVVEGFKGVIAGKTVVEIGAGVGLLALEMAKHAAFVWGVEIDPAWSWVFTKYLYRTKPRNLTWIFGDAATVLPWLRADVVVLRTRSGVRALVQLAETIAPVIVLSACAEPLIVQRGSAELRELSEYIDTRVTNIIEAIQDDAISE